MFWKEHKLNPFLHTPKWFNSWCMYEKKSEMSNMPFDHLLNNILHSQARHNMNTVVSFDPCVPV